MITNFESLTSGVNQPMFKIVSRQFFARSVLLGLALFGFTASPLLAQTHSGHSPHSNSHNSGGDHGMMMTPEAMQKHHQAMLAEMRQMLAQTEKMTPEMMAKLTPAQRQQYHQKMVAQMRQMVSHMEHMNQMMMPQGSQPPSGSPSGAMGSPQQSGSHNHSTGGQR